MVLCVSGPTPTQSIDCHVVVSKTFASLSLFHSRMTRELSGTRRTMDQNETKERFCSMPVLYSCSMTPGKKGTKEWTRRSLHSCIVSLIFWKILANAIRAVQHQNCGPDHPQHHLYGSNCPNVLLPTITVGCGSQSQNSIKSRSTVSCKSRISIV